MTPWFAALTASLLGVWALCKGWALLKAVI